MSSSSSAAPRCHHIKVSGVQCGSPALRNKYFCYYHQTNRPVSAACYYEENYAMGEIDLPVFEDAHSIQTVIHQVVQMVLQKRLEKKTASLVLYALQIASSNLKRIELEKPQPEQVVTEPEVAQIPGAEAEAEEMDEQSGNENPRPGTIQACHRPQPQTGNHAPRSYSGKSRRTSSIASSRDASRPSSWASSTAASISVNRGPGL
jgi:hypothetical protein